MILLIFLVAVGLGVFLESTYARIAPLIVATAYIVTLGPGAFSGGAELDKNKLIDQLKANWDQAEEIASFIFKYWYSIKYAMSAQKRGSTCSLMSLASLCLAGWYFFIDLPAWVWGWAFANAALLVPIGNKVNKALFILKHDRGSDDWDKACVALVALAAILKNENYRFLVQELLSPDEIQRAIERYRKG